MKLTAKQAVFVREYLIDLNGTQAAIRAGYEFSDVIENRSYVYFLINPFTGLIFYVGKGKKNRLSSHQRLVRRGQTDNAPKCEAIFDILHQGGEVVEVVFQVCKNDEEACKLERYLIKELIEFGLTNISHGSMSVIESQKSKVSIMLKRLKSFDEWNGSLPPDKKKSIEAIWGSPEDFYSKYTNQLKDLYSKISAQA